MHPGRQPVPARAVRALGIVTALLVPLVGLTVPAAHAAAERPTSDHLDDEARAPDSTEAPHAPQPETAGPGPGDVPYLVPTLTAPSQAEDTVAVEDPDSGEDAEPVDTPEVGPGGEGVEGAEDVPGPEGTDLAEGHRASRALSVAMRPGETTDEMRVDLPFLQNGLTEIVAPSHTRIVGARTLQGFPVYTISADGRTARAGSAATTGLGALTPMLTLAVDADAPTSQVYSDGEVRVLSFGGTQVLRSAPISVSVLGPPVVVTSPADQRVLDGQSAVFDSDVRAVPDATARWEVSTDGGATFSDVPGDATSASLTVHDVSLDMDGWQYRVRFTNAEGSAWSDPAVLTVSPVGFLEHPADVTVDEGEITTFSVRFVPAEDAVFGWEHSLDGVTWFQGTTIPGVFEAGVPASWLLHVGGEDGVTVRSDGRIYRAYLQYADHVVYSDTAVITVLPASVRVTEQPVSQSVLEGGAVTFSAAHGGTTFPVSAQWEVSTDGGETFDDVTDGATGTSLTRAAVTREMHGWQYRVRLTSAAGPTWAEAATLSVTHRMPDALGHADPGEVVDLRVYDPAMVRNGVMTITAPTGTTIGRAWHNGPSGPFVISEDGQTATSVQTSWGGHSLSAWVALRVADDAVPGTVLDDGTAQIADGGRVLASSTLTVTVTGEIEVVAQPSDVTVDVGTAAELTAPVSGHDVRTQWQVSTDSGDTWDDVAGATGTTLTLAETTPEMNGWWYRATHTNAAGAVVTDHAVLVVRVAPYFVQQPRPETFMTPGGPVLLAARAVDNVEPITLPLSWEHSLDGETWEPYEYGTYPDAGPVSVNILYLTQVTAEMDGVRFRAVAESHLGRAESAPGLVTVAADPVVAPHPSDARTLVGHEATFSAGTPAVSPHRTQQWQERTEGGDWTDIPGATDPTYRTGPATPEMDQREYRVVFTNHHGSTASEAATLTVRTPLPASVTVTPTVRLVGAFPR